MSGHKHFLLASALATVLILAGAAEGAGQYPWWGPYPRYYNVDPGAAMRLEVKPKEAEVYVDGYYAGIVDDFDGVFQRLRLPPGAHEIVLYRDGYHTVHQTIYLTLDNTFKLKLTMDRLAAGEQPDPRPQPATPPRTATENAPPRGPMGRRLPRSQPPSSRYPAPAPNQPSAAPPGAYGTLSIRVQPSDAEVMVDGERWQAPQGQESLTIDVPEGRHSIQIQKSGYRTYLTEVEVHRGGTTPLNVSLRSQDQPIPR